MIGVGIIIKAGIKALGNYAARNVGSGIIKGIREKFIVSGKKNIATLGGEVDGAPYYKVALSGLNEKNGTVGVPVIRRFTTNHLNDSEAKLLEDFASQFHKTPNVKGTLGLISERKYCSGH